MQMPDKLWDLANLVTGFAAVQSLTFIYGLVSLTLKLKGREQHVAAAIGTIAFTFLYAIAVIWCGDKGRSLDSPDHLQIWGWVTAGRLFVIVLFAMPALGATYGHWR